MHELSKLLEVKFRHATLKHAQSVGVVERSPGALKRILKLNTNEQWSKWQLYVPLATYIHNTSYYSSIGCSPTSIFHGREPIKPLDVRFNKSIKTLDLKSDFVTEIHDAVQKLFSETKLNLIHRYHQSPRYFDEKAAAQPLKLFSFCLILNTKLMNQNDFGKISMNVWIPRYRVEKVLTHSNYLIRKVGTNYTQCLHRIRLRPYEPLESPVDLQKNDPKLFVPEPALGKYRQEPELFGEQIPNLLDQMFAVDIPGQEEQEDDQPVSTTLSYEMAGPPDPAVGAIAISPPVHPLPPHLIKPENREIPVERQVAPQDENIEPQEQVNVEGAQGKWTGSAKYKLQSGKRPFKTTTWAGFSFRWFPRTIWDGCKHNSAIVPEDYTES